MWDRIKSDRRVQFASGLAVVFVAVNWLFTNKLFYAAVDLQQQPVEGQTSTGVTLTAIGPMVVDLIVGALIFIGAWVLNVSEWLFGRVKQATVEPSVNSPPEPVVSVGFNGLSQEMILNLGRAALENDQAKLKMLQGAIRKPKAIAELAEACGKGDMKTAADRFAEIEEMVLEESEVQSVK